MEHKAEPGRVRGKVALVTAAGSGIGRAKAILLAKEGATVVASDINVSAAEGVAGDIRRGGGKADQWASVRLIAPDLFARTARYEREFGKTIHGGKSVVDLADRGTPYPECYDRQLVALAMGRSYPAPLALTDNWTLPPGAFRHCAGPS